MNRHERHWARGEAEMAVADEFEGLGLGARPWTVVVRFYAALHCTTAYLRTKYPSFDPKRHEERAQLIRATAELSVGKNRRFHAAYQRLKDMSEQVRYDPGFHAGSSELSNARKDLDCVFKHLSRHYQKAQRP